MKFDPTGPMGRVARAEQIGEELAARIGRWQNGADLRPIAAIAPDRLSFEVTLGVGVLPPYETWAHIFGEGVHHLRAALDNAVVQFALGTGAAEKSVRKLQFPIIDAEKDWDSTAWQRTAVPDVLLSRIRAVQPWERARGGAPFEHDLLRLLRDLDNRDKHWVHAQATVLPLASENRSTMEFESAAAAAAEGPPQTEVFTPEMSDGALLLRCRTKSPIVRVSGYQGVTMQVTVRAPGGTDLPICGILAALAFNTRLVLQWLATGEAPTGVAAPSGSDHA
jgi:hypothetical protein